MDKSSALPPTLAFAPPMPTGMVSSASHAPTVKSGMLKACPVFVLPTTTGMDIPVLPALKAKFGMIFPIVAAVPLAKTGTAFRACPAQAEGHGTHQLTAANALEDSTGTERTALAAQPDQTGTVSAASHVPQARFGTQSSLPVNVRQVSSGTEQPASLLALQE